MIALTMGDPAGVGPEIVLKALAAVPRRGPRLLWVGDPELLAFTARRLGLPVAGQAVADLDEAHALPPGRPALLSTPDAPVDLGVLRLGQPDSRHAPAIMASIQTACRLALAGEVAAVVTPPASKAVMIGGGFDFPGHTEVFGRCCNAGEPVMMLAGRGLRVVPATIHQALASVPQRLDAALLNRVITTTHDSLRTDFGLAAPRIAVAGLNPHAGEGGAFGDEEQRLIGPVCDRLRARFGPEALRGPLPADTLFHPSARRGYDAVVCMYHDQALIPLKMLAFGQAVNVTLGLPIVRTSVDHGTAFDIAGHNRADPRSLLAAIRLAARMAANRARGTMAPAAGSPR